MSESLEILLTEEQIQSRVKELAAEIKAKNYPNLLLIGILKGSVFFLADLARHLDPSVEIDFIQVSSYFGKTFSSGVVQVRKDLDAEIEGRNVILVEDIIDSGLTIQHLMEWLGDRNPASIEVCTMLRKQRPQPPLEEKHIKINYVGFEIADHFVVGYGLDYVERFRNLPYIAILRES